MNAGEYDAFTPPHKISQRILLIILLAPNIVIIVERIDILFNDQKFFFKKGDSMNIWFIRSGGDTPLNNPASLDYVPGEPPKYPKTRYEYLNKCLEDGFARIGWPNTGDLTLLESNPPRLAPFGYSYNSIESEHRKYLDQFVTIKAGDLVLTPAMGEDSGEGQVHLGIVLTKDKKKIAPYINPRPDAYYYYFDLKNKDWYECAHRVNVLWAKKDGEYTIFDIKATYFPIWRRAFNKINASEGKIYQLAQKAGLF